MIGDYSINASLICALTTMVIWTSYLDSLDSFEYDAFFETSTLEYSSTRMENNRTDSGKFL